jgi:hypothetical protein
VPKAVHMNFRCKVSPTNHGATHEIHGFVSETEARDWIR